MIVYLCGPMVGLTVEESGSWRREAESFLNGCFFQVYNPMRHVPALDPDVKLRSYYGRCEEVGLADKYNLKMSDVVLCKLDRPSIGTAFELGMARALGKTIVAFGVSSAALDHPLIYRCWGIEFSTLNSALSYIKNLEVK